MQIITTNMCQFFGRYLYIIGDRCERELCCSVLNIVPKNKYKTQKLQFYASFKDKTKYCDYL